jgi:hypothetical protein
MWGFKSATTLHMHSSWHIFLVYPCLQVSGNYLLYKYRLCSPVVLTCPGAGYSGGVLQRLSPLRNAPSALTPQRKHHFNTSSMHLQCRTIEIIDNNDSFECTLANRRELSIATDAVQIEGRVFLQSQSTSILYAGNSSQN